MHIVYIFNNKVALRMNPRVFKSLLWGWNKISSFWCGAGDSWPALFAPEWVGTMPVACYGTLPRAALPWSPRKQFDGTRRPAFCDKAQNRYIPSATLSPNNVITSHPYFFLKQPAAQVKPNAEEPTSSNQVPQIWVTSPNCPDRTVPSFPVLQSPSRNLHVENHEVFKHTKYLKNSVQDFPGSK